MSCFIGAAAALAGSAVVRLIWPPREQTAFGHGLEVGSLLAVAVLIAAVALDGAF